jgi:hypothetical protein
MRAWDLMGYGFSRGAEHVLKPGKKPSLATQHCRPICLPSDCIESGRVWVCLCTPALLETRVMFKSDSIMIMLIVAAVTVFLTEPLGLTFTFHLKSLGNSAWQHSSSCRSSTLFVL